MQCGNWLVLFRLDREPGKGRALGVGTVKFTGEVLQNTKLIKYEIDMKKLCLLVELQ